MAQLYMAQLRTLTMALVVTLWGCSNDSFEHRLKDYNARLERVLEQAPTAQASAHKPRFPAKRALVHEIPGIDIDLFDFLKLGDCHVQSVIAEKNSSLGRFAVPSIALAQDVAFIRGVEQCLTTLAISEEHDQLITTLKSAQEQKLRDLPKRAWNALFAGDEYRQFWTRETGDYPANIESRLPLALNALQKNMAALDSKTTLPTFDAEEFEAALNILRSGEAAALLDSWTLVLTHLNQGSSIVDTRAKSRPLCFEDMRNPKAEIFRNVVIDRFVAGLQKDIATLNQRYYEVLLPLRRLEEQFQAVETPAYAVFRRDRDALLAEAIGAVKSHVAAVEPLMVQCGFIPER